MQGQGACIKIIENLKQSQDPKTLIVINPQNQEDLEFLNIIENYEDVIDQDTLVLDITKCSDIVGVLDIKETPAVFVVENGNIEFKGVAEEGLLKIVDEGES